MILIKLEKVHYFLSYYSIESIRHNSLKFCKFLKIEFRGKYIPISSRATFIRFFFYLKLMLILLIKSFYFVFSLSNCPSDIIHLFLRTNVHLFNVLTILIHHFMLFFSILSQKEKFYVKRKNNIQSSYINFFSCFMSDGHIF